MDAVPISVALVAGGLAVINPCSFPLLPAFLSFYVGADEAKLPRTATRVAQGLIVASLGGSKVAVFLAYGIGMAVVLMSVAVAVALLRDGVTRFLRPLLPHMSRIAGALLVVSGAYLTHLKRLPDRGQLGLAAHSQRPPAREAESNRHLASDAGG